MQKTRQQARKINQSITCMLGSGRCKDRSAGMQQCNTGRQLADAEAQDDLRPAQAPTEAEEERVRQRGRTQTAKLLAMAMASQQKLVAKTP
jgi:hypothetical protein